MALSGVVLPATLVTRWFNQGRGKVLGLVHVPIAVAIVPLLPAALITRYDVALAYGTFAVLIGIVLVPLALWVVDYPGDKTQAQARNAASTQSTSDGIMGLQILRSPRFWAVAVASAVIVSGVVVLSTHMMPMTVKWGISTAAGATLLSVCALAAIPGSVLWGWLADKIGGGPALTLAAVNCAILWSVLLAEPSYALTLPVIGLLGLHGSASVPLVSMALSQAFGQASFSRAFGLSTLMTLPFTVIGIQAASSIFVRTGSYVTVIIVFIAAFLVVAPMPYLARQRA
jgi:sugar phosphate permease